MTKSELESWKKEMLLRLKSSSSSKSTQVDSQTLLNCPVGTIDPALSRARQRLDEIAREQKELNKKKNLLSKETKQILKQNPSLASK